MKQTIATIQVKAEELKLKNLVLYSYKGNDELCEIYSVSENLVECRFVKGMREDMTTGIFVHPSYLHGVQLSEEWLIKLGYYKCQVAVGYYRTRGHVVWRVEGMFYCEKNGVKLNSVSQLQNLYYFITGGEELKIKKSNGKHKHNIHK